MTKIVTHLLEPAAATKSRTVGLFLWQLDDQSRLIGAYGSERDTQR